MTYPNDPRRVSESDGMSAGAMAGIALLLCTSMLVKMKRESGRPQDLEDARALEKLAA